MEETIALIESRIRELESPESPNHSVTLQNPYPLAGLSTSAVSSGMNINMDMFLGSVAWAQPPAYDAVSGVALPSPIPASMGKLVSSGAEWTMQTEYGRSERAERCKLRRSSAGGKRPSWVSKLDFKC